MEKEHLIIIAILGVILYMCMNKSEGFNYQQGGIGDYKDTQRIRYEKPGPDLHIRYQSGTLSTNPNARISNMNIMGSQYVTGHIRRDRRNNMMNSMLYGYQNDCATDPAQCGQF
jgi:hypothetical protein